MSMATYKYARLPCSTYAVELLECPSFASIMNPWFRIIAILSALTVSNRKMRMWIARKSTIVADGIDGQFLLLLSI